MTVPVVLAAAPPVATEKQSVRDMFDDMAQDCGVAYFAYKYLGDKESKILAEKMKKYGPNGQMPMALICIGYGVGYEDGRRVS